MVITDITTGVQSVASTGPVTGTLDTSALTGDYTVEIGIVGLSAGKTVVIAVEDTANVTPFSDAIQVAVFQYSGAVTAATDITQSIRKYQIPGTRFGVTNAKLRLNVLSATSTPGLKVHGWLVQ